MTEIIPKQFGSTTEVGDKLHTSEEGQSLQKPRIILIGRERSGKSSILSVLFFKMLPQCVDSIESTSHVVKYDISTSSFLQFELWDVPGRMAITDPGLDLQQMFGEPATLVYVVDAQPRRTCTPGEQATWEHVEKIQRDDYTAALDRLLVTLCAAQRINAKLNVAVLVHKADGVPAELQPDLQRYILQCVTADLAQDNLDHMSVSYYLTSVHDYSLTEAFSHVVHKLNPQLPTLENLLDVFASNSGIEKVFLFDVVSKIYIATDSAPVDPGVLELCCDTIDVAHDLSLIYGRNEEDEGGFDSESFSSIKLSTGRTLYLRQINPHLVMVCIIRTESGENEATINYNFTCLRKAVQDVITVSRQLLADPPATSRPSSTPSSSVGQPSPVTFKPSSTPSSSADLPSPVTHGSSSN